MTKPDIIAQDARTVPATTQNRPAPATAQPQTKAATERAARTPSLLPSSTAASRAKSTATLSSPSLTSRPSSLLNHAADGSAAPDFASCQVVYLADCDCRQRQQRQDLGTRPSSPASFPLHSVPSAFPKGSRSCAQIAWSTSKARVRAYMDVDLSTDIRQIPELVGPILDGRADVCFGSRLLPASRGTLCQTRAYLTLV
ncbi:MAG: hypothetical protein ACLU0O_11480 [Collinsella sp.]